MECLKKLLKLATNKEWRTGYATESTRTIGIKQQTSFAFGLMECNKIGS